MSVKKSHREQVYLTAKVRQWKAKINPQKAGDIFVAICFCLISFILFVLMVSYDIGSDYDNSVLVLILTLSFAWLVILITRGIYYMKEMDR